VQFATFGAEVDGDNSTPLPAGTYLVTDTAASSGFPATVASGTACAAGDVLVIASGITVTPKVGDKVVTLTLADQCDLSSWKMDFSKAEIDVSTLCDAVKKYRAGRADMAGTMNGVFTVGTTDAISGKMREFIDIVRQDGATSFDRFSQTENILLGIFYLNADTNVADKMYVIAPFQLFGESIGGEMGSAQSFSASFRFANLTYTNSADDVVTIQPTFYRLGDGA
jgi:hypothetical protein